MSREVRVGLLDSGVAAALGGRVAVDSAFALDARGAIERRAAVADAIGHGSSIAQTILAAAPDAAIVSAQAFSSSLVAPPAVIAAALRWLVEQRVRVVNLSFGLGGDRAVLREACRAARARGTILVAAAPARGPAVFPAAYPGVIRVSGDARCAAGEVSTLGGAQADFGACGRTIDGRVRGASAAAAHVTGRVAALLADEPAADAGSVARLLASAARYHGPERRGEPSSLRCGDG